MGTSAQKLQKIRDSKEAIRLAIAAKGVTIPANTKLADYDDKIALIDEWVAPADWIQLEEPADNEILLLASDINPYYAFVVNVTGGYTVDWGDGTIDNWASGAIASHTYTVGTGQACSRGYTTFKIRIFAQTPANQITLFNVKPTQVNISNSILWAKFGTKNISFSNMFFFRNNPIARSYYIECAEFPENMTSTNGGMGDTFNGCISLQKFKAPKTHLCTASSYDEAFTSTKLKTVDLGWARNVQTCLSAPSPFCEKIILPESFGYASNQRLFFSGVKQKEIVLPPPSDTQINGTQFMQGFAGYKLTFPSSYENKIRSLQYFFNGCNRLNDLSFVQSVNLTNSNIQEILNNCLMLETFYFPANNGVNITVATSCFNGCTNLKTINNFPQLVYVTSYNNIFNNCYMLKNIDNLDKLGDTTTPMDLSGAYAGCYSLNPVGGLKVRNNISGRFILSGQSATYKAALQALLFTNPAAVSTWAGSSPQIDISYCSMEAAALNALFTSIIATSASFSGKTIRITGNPGAATCDTTIITNAGGTVNKTT